jgi:Bacterial Ig-like domain (group 2)
VCRRLGAGLVGAFILLSGACSTTGNSVTGVNVTGVNVTAPATSLIVTATLQLTATVLPSGSPQTVTWGSSDPSLASVDPNGLVTGNIHGSVTITATSTADPNIKGTIQLTVAGCPTPRAAASSITTATTWQDWILDPICFDYEAKQAVTVNGAVLTIEPGVVVGFDQGRLLVTRTAGLDAAGTSAKPIRLSGITPTRGIWDGIELQATQDPANRIENTTIEYAGGHGGGGGIQPANLTLAEGAQTTLVNVILRQSAGYGMYLQRLSSIPGGYSGGSITENALGVAYAHASVAHLLGSSGTMPAATGNDRDAIDVLADEIDSNVSWNALGVPYHIIANPNKLIVRGTLMVGSGVVIEFEQDQAMTVSGGGNILAMGTAQAPIFLTGAQHVKGSWRGLQISDTHSVLDHVIIEYGGGPGLSGFLQPADLIVSSGATGVPTSLVLRNTVLRESAGYGLYTRAADVSLDEFTNNTLTANTLGPGYVAATHIDIIQADGSYTGNAIDRMTVQIEGGDITQSTTMHAIGIPWQLVGGSSKTWLISNTDFTIEKGVDIYMSNDIALNVRGASFTAEGTMNNRIRLLGDGTSWSGIYFFESTASLDYMDLADAGGKKFGGVNVPGAIVIASAGMNTSTARITHNVTSSNAPYDVVFSFGPTYAQGCIGRTYIPPPDVVSDHCRA